MKKQYDIIQLVLLIRNEMAVMYDMFKRMAAGSRSDKYGCSQEAIWCYVWELSSEIPS